MRSRNPPATRSEHAAALALARRIADEESRNGAKAVVLAGSWASRTAHRGSDLDLWVLGARGGHRFYDRDGLSVSVSWKTVSAGAREFVEPRSLGEVVSAWRSARILWDPEGVAARLKRRARGFRWDRVASRCDRYVARVITELSEEVAKLTRHLEEGEREAAAIQRDRLVDSLSFVLAVELRLVFEERRLGPELSRRLGPGWRRVQSEALGLRSVGLERSCWAAFELYRMSVERVAAHLTPDQRTVVDRALSLAVPDPSRR